MTRYQVDSEAVLSGGAAIHASIGRIQAEVSGMYSQLTSLEASWTGQAASAFQNVVGDCRIRQQRVEESLAAINQALASRRAAVRRRGAAERQTLFRLAVAS